MHERTGTTFPSKDPILPEVYTATVLIACIYNLDGKCKCMLTPSEIWKIIQRLMIRQDAAAYMKRSTASCNCFASELAGLFQAKSKNPILLDTSPVMLNQWHGQIVWFPLGFIMRATVLWLFSCLASLDGPLKTDLLFSQTCLITISSVCCLSRRFLLAWRKRWR